MQIFDSIQTNRPAGCENMTQYLNVSSSILQLDGHGAYLGLNQVVICFENSHIRRALDGKKLIKIDFPQKQETKNYRKSKKTEDIIVEPEIDETQQTNSNDNVAEDSEQDLPVVATEVLDI